MRIGWIVIVQHVPDHRPRGAPAKRGNIDGSEVHRQENASRTGSSLSKIPR
jgi:hypothetical protein